MSSCSNDIQRTVGSLIGKYAVLIPGDGFFLKSKAESEKSKVGLHQTNLYVEFVLKRVFLSDLCVRVKLLLENTNALIIMPGKSILVV